jgi:hypothetical protein
LFLQLAVDLLSPACRFFGGGPLASTATVIAVVVVAVLSGVDASCELAESSDGGGGGGDSNDGWFNDVLVSSGSAGADVAVASCCCYGARNTKDGRNSLRSKSSVVAVAGVSSLGSRGRFALSIASFRALFALFWFFEISSSHFRAHRKKLSPFPIPTNARKRVCLFVCV